MDPGYRLSPALATEGNLLYTLWEETRDTGIEQPMPVPLGCLALIDGQPTSQRPLYRAIILQACSQDGAVLTTQRLTPGDPLPEWPCEIPLRQRLIPTLTLGAGASLGVSAGLWIGALITKSNYQVLIDGIPDGQTDPGQVSRIYQTQRWANRLAYAAQGTAILGLSLAGTVIVLRW